MLLPRVWLALVVTVPLAVPALAEETVPPIPSPDRQADTTDAAGAPFPESWRGMLGPWSLEAADAGEFACTIGLTEEPTIGGYGVEVPSTCLVSGPTIDIAAWHIDEADGSVVFTDALRQVVLRLGEEGDGGIFASDIAAPPQYYLVATE